MLTYLETTTLRLAQGVADLPQPCRVRHARYLKVSQSPDGGFAGREGESDLYYTAFALRSLAILGELEGDVAERAATYLRNAWPNRTSLADFVSLVYGVATLEISAGIDVFAGESPRWRDSVAKSLEQLRCRDGGYAKSAEGTAGSTYYTFLALVCLQLVEQLPEHSERIVDFILSQRCEGGGFREIRAAKRAGTNPTAAAIGGLQMLKALDDDVRRQTIEFLAEMQMDEGGLRANTRIPIADLLSTFTGSLTLMDLKALDQIQIAAAGRYVESLECTEGGFHGAAWDEARDVEYTFYGLGSLGILGTLSHVGPAAGQV